ncbi:glutathione S-transferase N-terminal domain-containing protein [Saliphagus infecundisoli]|uniref:Glutathione S-transferase N-terminal domain-containing protein n=1 Tax=Saliphagus infecundisoli TaxID=1849069 RepID=A0ABD5QB82_9EURY|nr:glutathione S-transferase N-terminal domain-containing protein [Saliphagus infecundisoli]
MAPDSDAPITFYRLQACPFCERVTRTLDACGLEYRSRFVEPMHSDRNVVKRVSGKRSVPAIVDPRTGVTMSESANIVDYLERTYGESAAISGRREDESAATDGPHDAGTGGGD